MLKVFFQHELWSLSEQSRLKWVLSRWHHTPPGIPFTRGDGLFWSQWPCWISPPMPCGWATPQWQTWSQSILIRASMLWICWAQFPCMLEFPAAFWSPLFMTIWWGEILLCEFIETSIRGSDGECTLEPPLISLAASLDVWAPSQNLTNKCHWTCSSPWVS